MNMSLFPDVVVNGETIPSAAIAAEIALSIPPDMPIRTPGKPFFRT